MSFDARQAFQDEARELLVELESALLELDQKRQDPEVVGRAFRALHTIKGSGAMLGFDEISSFAHNLESAFDRLRNGTLAASTELINLTLAAADQIKGMLDAVSGSAAPDPARTAAIVEELRLLIGMPPAQPHDSKSGKPETGSAAVNPVDATLPRRIFKIHFRPSPDVLLNGVNPLLLLRELGTMGDLEVFAETAAIPLLGEIDPERCYLAWDLLLTTTSEEAAIRDVFIFVEGESDLTVELVEPVAAVEAQADEPAPSSGML